MFKNINFKNNVFLFSIMFGLFIDYSHADNLNIIHFNQTASSEDEINKLINNNFVVKSIPSPSSYIVFDFQNQQILEQKNEHLSLPIASVTKLMTANVFMQLNNNPNCAIAITDEDNDTIKNTKTRLPKNIPLSCSSLLKAMLVSSDNYAASALSRSIDGYTKQDFINQMNHTAKQWGMNNTFFVDPSGLSYKNRSSVYDLVTLSHHSMLNPNIRNITGFQSVDINPINNHQKISFRNSNSLVRNGNYSAFLSKTGYIRESGYNLVFVNGNKCANNRMIGVISLNNSSSSNRALFTMDKLVNYGCY